MQFFGQWDKPLLGHDRISIARWPYRYVQRVIKKTVRLFTCLMMFLVSPETIANTSAAFFYGKPVPSDLLSRFEQIIVEPDNIDDISQLVAKGGQVRPLMVETHLLGLDIAEWYGFSFYDSLIVGVALLPDCSTLVLGKTCNMAKK